MDSHVIAYEILNDVITLLNLRKNTENCLNRRKSNFECNVFPLFTLKPVEDKRPFLRNGTSYVGL